MRRLICAVLDHRWARVDVPELESNETYLKCRRCGHEKYDAQRPIGAVGIIQHVIN